MISEPERGEASTTTTPSDSPEIRRLRRGKWRAWGTVPGSPLDPRARGCNKLLRDGAGLVERAEDVIEVVNRILASPLREPPRPPVSLARPAGAPPADAAETEAARAAVETLLGASPVTVDELARSSALALPALQQVLLELELAGRLERHPGQQVALVMSPCGAENTGE